MNRRKFIRTGSAITLAAAVPLRLHAQNDAVARMLDAAPSPGSDDLKQLAARALDSARSAGAVYADVQFRTTRLEFWLGARSEYETRLVTAAGVRALYNGYWGFAALDGLVNPDEMAKLGREATAQARTGALGKLRTVSLPPAPVVANGNWTTPVELDPFSVDISEKSDFLQSVNDYYRRQTYGVGATASMRFMRDDRTFASSEGTFTSQTIYTSAAGVQVAAEQHFRTEQGGQVPSDFAQPAGAGWEYVLRAPFRRKAAELIEQARRLRTPKPVDVGRYDVVFDAHAMAMILDATAGGATDVERAFGYRANSVGTSFLNDPLEMLGNFTFGSTLVNVTANRSMKGGAGTVKWDNEGVEPADFTLVKDGILTDFQTTRESAGWLEPYYSKSGRVARSNGCAGSHAATMPQTVMPPNLVLESGKGNDTFESLVSSTKKGLAVVGGRVRTDQQCLNGDGAGTLIYEIVNGQLGQAIGGANYLFRAPEFWKNVVALGGAGSKRTFGMTRYPQYPTLATTLDTSSHSIVAVPARVNQIAIVDVMRKA